MGRSIIVSSVTYMLGFLGQEKHFHKTFQQYVSDKLVNPEVKSPSFWIAVSDTELLALKQLFECVFCTIYH